MSRKTAVIGFSQLFPAIKDFLDARRAQRAVRAEQIELATLLSDYYGSNADRAEMDAILGRHEASETHRVWDALPVGAGSWGRH